MKRDGGGDDDGDDDLRAVNQSLFRTPESDVLSLGLAGVEGSGVEWSGEARCRVWLWESWGHQEGGAGRWSDAGSMRDARGAPGGLER